MGQNAILNRLLEKYAATPYAVKRAASEEIFHAVRAEMTAALTESDKSQHLLVEWILRQTPVSLVLQMTIQQGDVIRVGGYVSDGRGVQGTVDWRQVPLEWKRGGGWMGVDRDAEQSGVDAVALELEKVTAELEALAQRVAPIGRY